MFKKCIAKVNTSFFYSAILRIVSRLKSVFIKSRFYAFVMSPSQEKCGESFFCNLINNISSALKKLCRGSALFKGIESSYAGQFLKIEYAAPLFFALMLIFPHEMWNNAYGVLGALVLCFIYLCSGSRGEVSPYLLIFMISALGGVFITPYFADGVKTVLFLFSAIIFMQVVKGGINSEKSLIFLLYALVGALFVMSIYAIIQNFAGVETQALLTDTANNKGMPGRVYSTVENPNNFAEIIVLIIPFVFALFLQSKNIRVKILLALVFAVSFIALMMTYSRGCYVSFAISLIVFIALYNWKYLLPLGILGIMCIPVLPDSVLNRILTIGSLSDTSNAYRVFLWEGVIKLIKANFLTGVGLGGEAFRAAYAPFASRFAQNAAHSHMLYLQLFAELGIIGGISFFAFMLSSLKKGFAAFNKADENLRCIIIAAISSFAGISFSAATEYIWFYPRVMFVFFIVLGILLCAVKLAKKTEASQ